MNASSQRNNPLKSQETFQKISRTNATASLNNSIDKHDTLGSKTKSDEINMSAFIGSQNKVISNIDAT